VGAVVVGAAAHVGRVLVVDDGSRDGTAAAAAAAGAEVLRQPENRGKGAAILAGLRHLGHEGVTHVVTLDADGQHLPEEIPVLLEEAARAPDALVVGVRRRAGYAIAAKNRFGNWVADALMRWIVGQPLPDTQSGFRVYPVAPCLGLGATGSRFDFETEILLRAARRGLPIRGVPVRVFYPPAGERVSHYRPWADTVRIIRTVVGILVRERDAS